MEDIGIKDTIRFSVRCAALFINKDKILIHRKRGDRFYTLPGGKCKLGEDSRHAVEREIAEELNFNATMKRMVFIGENFFRFQHTKRHEILFCIPGFRTVYATTYKADTGQNKNRKPEFRMDVNEPIKRCPLEPVIHFRNDQKRNAKIVRDIASRIKLHSLKPTSGAGTHS